MGVQCCESMSIIAFCCAATFMFNSFYLLLNFIHVTYKIIQSETFSIYRFLSKYTQSWYLFLTWRQFQQISVCTSSASQCIVRLSQIIQHISNVTVNPHNLIFRFYPFQRSYRNTASDGKSYSLYLNIRTFVEGLYVGAHLDYSPTRAIEIMK